MGIKQEVLREALTAFIRSRGCHADSAVNDLHDVRLHAKIVHFEQPEAFREAFAQERLAQVVEARRQLHELAEADKLGPWRQPLLLTARWSAPAHALAVLMRRCGMIELTLTDDETKPRGGMVFIEPFTVRIEEQA